MNVLAATIVIGQGCDDIMLEVDKPNGCHPFTGNACVTLKVASGTADDYMAKNFPGVNYDKITRGRSVWTEIPRISAVPPSE